MEPRINHSLVPKTIAKNPFVTIHLLYPIAIVPSLRNLLQVSSQAPFPSTAAATRNAMRTAIRRSFLRSFVLRRRRRRQRERRHASERAVPIIRIAQ